MNKLCVAGCSFSDYTQVDTTYGELLSKKINYDYLHEGAGCGSNFRIWRRIVNHVLDGALTPDDILIIQYTQKNRREFFHREPPELPPERGRVTEIYDEGSLLRYKVDSHTWHRLPDQALVLKNYETFCLNSKYDDELFKVNNSMFQEFLFNKKIKTIFLKNRYTMEYDHLITNSYFEQFVYHEDSYLKDIKYRLLPDDYGHLSADGHLAYSKELFDHIRDIGWI